MVVFMALMLVLAATIDAVPIGQPGQHFAATAAPESSEEIGSCTSEEEVTSPWRPGPLSLTAANPVRTPNVIQQSRYDQHVALPPLQAPIAQQHCPALRVYADSVPSQRMSYLQPALRQRHNGAIAGATTEHHHRLRHHGDHAMVMAPRHQVPAPVTSSATAQRQQHLYSPVPTGGDMTCARLACTPHQINAIAGGHCAPATAGTNGHAGRTQLEAHQDCKRLSVLEVLAAMAATIIVMVMVVLCILATLMLWRSYWRSLSADMKAELIRSLDESLGELVGEMLRSLMETLVCSVANCGEL